MHTKKSRNNRHVKRHVKRQCNNKKQPLTYNGVLCKLIGGGLLSFFKKIMPHKKIKISMTDMNSYTLCDKLDGKWDSISSSGQPSYQFFNSQDNISKLKKLGIIIGKTKDNIISCHRSKHKSYKGISDDERRKKFTNKKFRFVYVPYSGTQSKDYSTSERYTGCESEYKKMEYAAIDYLLSLMNIIKKIVNECMDLRYPAEVIKSLKCIITIFNNSDLINLLFNGTNESRYNSSTGKTVISTLFKNTAYIEYAPLFTLLQGSSGSSGRQDNYYGSSSESSSITTSALNYLKMEMFFEDSKKHEIYRKFLNILLSTYIQPAIDQLSVELTNL
jgi:hypothetical protein